MAFAIGSPPASREARAPTPADELLRMRLQAVEAVEFRGTALLSAEPSPRASSSSLRWSRWPRVLVGIRLTATLDLWSLDRGTVAEHVELGLDRQLEE